MFTSQGNQASVKGQEDGIYNAELMNREGCQATPREFANVSRHEMAENATIASRCEVDRRAAAKWNLRTALALVQQARLWHLLLPSRRDLAYLGTSPFG